MCGQVIYSWAYIASGDFLCIATSPLLLQQAPLYPMEHENYSLIKQYFIFIIMIINNAS